MKHFQKIIFALLLLFVFNFSFAQKTGSEKEDKIHVSIAEKSTSFKEVKVETVIYASMKEIVDFVTNIAKFNTWMYKCRDSKMLETIEQNNYIYYVQIDMPFPAGDRDVVVHSNYNWAPDGKSFHLVSSAKNDYLALNDDYVRVEELNTEWRFTEISPNKTSVVHLNKINPAGNLPKWMLNLGAEIGPSRTVENLKNKLDKKGEKLFSKK